MEQKQIEGIQQGHEHNKEFCTVLSRDKPCIIYPCQRCPHVPNICDDPKIIIVTCTQYVDSAQRNKRATKDDRSK